MLPDGNKGDFSCFTCGHVAYFEALPQPTPGEKLDRRPSHGGQSLI
jgi:hypothetical protein